MSKALLGVGAFAVLTLVVIIIMIVDYRSDQAETAGFTFEKCMLVAEANHPTESYANLAEACIYAVSKVND